MIKVGYLFALCGAQVVNPFYVYVLTKFDVRRQFPSSQQLHARSLDWYSLGVLIGFTEVFLHFLK